MKGNKKRRTVQIAATTLSVALFTVSATLAVGTQFAQYDINNTIEYECEDSNEFQFCYEQDLNNLKAALDNGSISTKKYLKDREYLDSAKYKNKLFYELHDIDESVKQEIKETEDAIKDMASASFAGIAVGISALMATAVTPEIVHSMKIAKEDGKKLREREKEYYNSNLEK